MRLLLYFPDFFLFKQTPTPEIYTLSLHDALPICSPDLIDRELDGGRGGRGQRRPSLDIRSTLIQDEDRKSTRLNSSHQINSYAVFCLKKKTYVEHTPS